MNDQFQPSKFDQFLDTYDDDRRDIQKRLAALEDVPATPPDDDPINAEIYTALAQAQIEITNAAANVDNDFTGKAYANLAAVLDAVRGPLARNGIAIFQPTFQPEQQGAIGIHTILAHTSGEYLRDSLTMVPPKTDPQGIGSCRTYMRRYSLMAMTGIAGALDDDAESTKEDINAYERITAEEAEKVVVTAHNLFGADDDKVVARMLKGVFSTSELSITAIPDLPAGCADQAITALKNQAKREKAEAKKTSSSKDQDE